MSWIALIVLSALASPARALEAKDQALVGQALRAADTGDWERAFDLLEPVRDPLPAKTLRWMRMVRDQGRESFAQIAQFMIANPHWPLADELQAIAERRLIDPVDHELVRRFFAEREPLSTRAHVRYAQALLQVGEDERARELIRRAWVQGDFVKADESNFLARHGRLLTADDHIARLDNLLWDERLGSAERMLARVPREHRLLAEARLRLQRRQGGVDRAIYAVPEGLRDDPGLVFDRLRWRRQKHLHEGAVQILLDPPAEVGRAGMWWFEREYQIRRALRERDFDLAWRLVSRHRQTEGINFAEAEWLAGWLALRFQNQPRTALRHFERMHAAVSTPISRGRAAYWSGRAAAALGDSAAAQSWYAQAAAQHITFYGHLAAAELGKALAPEPEAVPTPAESAIFETNELVRVARMLIAAGAARDLTPFLLQLTKDARTAGEVSLVAKLATESGRPDLVTRVGKYASYGGIINTAAAFPIPGIERLVRPPAGEPEAALLLAVARQESLFNQDGVSGAGARGVLQLMPGTAKLVARQLGLRYDPALLTGDPDYNVRLGSHYLKTLLQRYRGELPLALAAYNAGPSRVEDWMRLHGDPRRGDLYTLIDWLELIPFAETRNYVQRVLENYSVYRRLLAGAPTLAGFMPPAGPLGRVPRPPAKPQDLAATSAPVLADEAAAAAAAPGRAPAITPVPKPVSVVPASFPAPPTPVRKPSLEIESEAGPLAQPPRPRLKPGLAGVAGEEHTTPPWLRVHVLA